jgi:hypothetical protein
VVEFQLAAVTTTHCRERRVGFEAARRIVTGIISVSRNRGSQPGRIAMN